ncbi:LIM and calponin homology domains-containing protein 1 [Oncorhynchus tshawytscha]|uniref:LIM and calponin homology domains-containing protein 1 n=1 Tax=Oncorhynchus tshawytscha TaxID=74940 RepID=UPI001C3D5085|nr:LIM and calponin homology domains-containing protein 1 [Oncorhynchus tshawytscha]
MTWPPDAPPRPPHCSQSVPVHPPPPACSLQDRELWEDIRRASHTALMDRMELETSHMGGVDAAHTPPPNPGPSPLSPEAPPTLLELEARLAQYERRVREEEEDGGRDERKVPDLQKDDMMARKTGAFPRTHNTTTTTFNRFLPLPGSKRPAQEVVTDRKLQQSRVSMDMPQQHPNVAMVIRPPVPSHCNYDDDDEDEEECPVPDLEKDDMLARRTGAYQHSAGRTGRSFNLFLPVPGAAQQKNTPLVDPTNSTRTPPLVDPTNSTRTPLWWTQPTLQEHPSGGPNQLYQNTSSGSGRVVSASQDLIRKEEERKRMERMMKEEEGGHTQKKKNIKTYREIVEDKERREAELCDAYRRAGSKAEAAMVLQRYALRFTISDSTLDSLQLPRTITTDQNPESRTPATNQNPEFRTTTTNQNPESRTPATNQNPESRTITTNQNPESRTITTNHNPESKTITTDQNPESRTIISEQNPNPRTTPNPKHPTHPTHAHTKPLHTKSAHTPPPISPSRPLPLLTAKPYCQPPQTQPGHKPVQPTEHPGANQKTQVSAVSALIGGRNCVVTTTIVTELTQTHLQPRPLDMLSNTQVNGSMALSRRSGEEAGSDSSLLSNQNTYSSSVTGGLEGSSGTMESPMLNLAKRVDHWVWNPEDERRRQEKWQQEQERFLQEQYLREQEKLKGEWERAQREVDEEERRHSEEEKKILEETATALSHPPPTELAVQTEVIVPAQQIYASWDCESSRGQETSLDRNQPCAVKRCVSGKRQCSGCNQVLGKGTAMNIDTLGLYFHLTCFKCGVCKVQLGDTSSGTDVRIRNGLLSCHDCYATSHAVGQPTTL